MNGRYPDLHRFSYRKSSQCTDGHDGEACISTPYAVPVLVIGAGGLGCELLHVLVRSGFHDIHVIDFDTIDLTNLNRQFLFREKDIGRFKAEVAAESITRRCPHVTIIPHACRMEDMDEAFYGAFPVILLGLDSIPARLWINATLAALSRHEVAAPAGSGLLGMVVVGERVEKPLPLLLDGGTEGYLGSLRVVHLGKGPCLECLAYAFRSEDAGVPLCTLANIPRQRQHCVLYVTEKVWAELRPDEPLNGDVEEHIQWVTAVALARQHQFHIEEDQPIDYSFTLGIVKKIIPAVGFTNALIASRMVVELLKLVLGVGEAITQPILYYGAGHARAIGDVEQPMQRSPTCEVCRPKAILGVSGTCNAEQLIRQVWEQSQEVAGSSPAALRSMRLRSTATSPVSETLLWCREGSPHWKAGLFEGSVRSIIGEELWSQLITEQHRCELMLVFPQVSVHSCYVKFVE